MKQAVIDIGTNSTRLCLAEVMADNSLTNINKFLTTTRLGEGSAEGILQPIPMERTANAVASYHRQAEQCGAERIYVYATAAVREAQNKDDFSQLLKNNGIELDILSGEQEAEIAYLGAVQDPDSAVIDIGGGSTEVMLKQNGKVCALSQRLGAVRLFELFGGRDGINAALEREVLSHIEPMLEQYLAISPQSAKNLVGVSGTATTLAAMSLKLKKYSGDKVQNTVLTLNEVDRLTRDLYHPLDKRLRIPGVPENRGDIIPFGAIILRAFMQKYDFSSLRVSDTDSLEGYLMLKNK